MSRIRLALAALTAAALIAVGGCSAGQPSGSPSDTGFGLAASPGDFMDRTPEQLDEIFAQYSSLGMTWLRTPVDWNLVQSTESSPYDWSHYDRVFAAAAAHGLQVIGLIGGTPEWARGDDCTGSGGWEFACPPVGDVEGYAALNAAMAARYPGMVIEIWNEPNVATFWSPRPDPVAYVQVLSAAYDAIKASSPDTTVLSAGLTIGLDPHTSVPPVEFLNAIYLAGGGKKFDGVGWHPYLPSTNGAPPPLPGTDSGSTAGWNLMAGDDQSARAVMTANGDDAKKIWVTEFGSNTDAGGALGASEERQAEIDRRAVELWKTYPWAGVFCFYTYRDVQSYGDTDNGEAYFGIWRVDGTPKPAVAAIRDAIAAGGGQG